MIRYALNLIDLKASGPGEKVAWWVDCTCRGQPCEIAHQKFGVRIYTGERLKRGRGTKDLEAGSEAARVGHEDSRAGSAVGSTRTPKPRRCDGGEPAPRVAGSYEYFRERALNPSLIEDEKITHDVSDPLGSAYTFKSGRIQMRMNAFRDLVAAISAHMSLLEHDLVLALAFTDFDPDNDDLTGVIGDRWGLKFARVLGNQEAGAIRFRDRLAAVVERWRNPYSHGGFEKGHGASIFLHAPGIGAVPVGMTSVRDSPHFLFIPASDTDISEVFALFDEFDEWLKTAIPYPMQWIESALDVRFDKKFRAEARKASRSPAAFEKFVERHGLLWERSVNMDF